MANSDSTQEAFRQRLIATLEFDGIQQNKRVSHLAKVCGSSISTARRMLSGKYNIQKVSGLRIFDIADGLNVHYRWVYDGLFEKFEPRTARIQLEMIDGEPTHSVDAIIDSVCTPIQGEPEHVYFGNATVLGIIIILEQHRRLNQWQKNRNLRFMLRLNNNDAKALRWLKMYSLGQISKQQIFQMA